MRRRWIVLGAVVFLVAWFGGTWAIVDWRNDSGPDFFCQEGTKSYLSAVAQGSQATAYLYNWKEIACGQPTLIPSATPNPFATSPN
jgi:hypothetical protein